MQNFYEKTPSPVESPLPAVILVRPQMGENIGAAARGMLNFGLSDLRIVAPRDGWPNEKAVEMAAGAFEIMPEPRVFATLAEALADLHCVYATTARPREMVKPVFTPFAAAADLTRRRGEGQKTGLVFGGERAGLSNDDVALCQNIVTVPVNPNFSSLNLGQAVLLMAYEVLQADSKHAAPALNPALDHGKSLPAPQALLDSFLGRLLAELERGNFFRSAGLRPTMERNIRNMFTRADLSEQEVKTLQGVITALTRQP